MTLQGAIDAELPGLRREAEARMASRATVHRKTGTTVQDENTGHEVPVWTAVHTDLPFRLKPGYARTVSIGGVEFSEATAEGHVPAGTSDLADGDLLEITSGEWAGAVYRLVEAVKGDQMTARRLPIAETDRPEEWA